MILNYTTEISAQRSVAEIIALLVKKGAQSITHEYFADGRVKSISFVMLVASLPVRFVLPTNAEGVAGILKKQKPWRNYQQGSRDRYAAKQREQAERVAWRILKDWVEAQVALIESGQAEPAQIFLPYAQQADGRTMYELFIENKQKQLAASSEPVM